jgi:chromosome segregation ATPase
MKTKKTLDAAPSVSSTVPEKDQLKSLLQEKVRTLENYLSISEELESEYEQEKLLNELESFCLDLIKKKNDPKSANIVKNLENAEEKSLQIKNFIIGKRMDEENELRKTLRNLQDQALDAEKEKLRIENFTSELKKKIGDVEKEYSHWMHQYKQTENKISCLKTNFAKTEETHQVNFCIMRKEYISAQERLNKEHEHALRILTVIDEVKS